MLDSPDWDWENGVCLKHLLPCVPCPQCEAEGDPGIEVTLSATERNELDFAPMNHVGVVRRHNLQQMLPPKLRTPGRVIRYAADSI